MKNENTSKRKLRRQKKELNPPKPKRLTKKLQRKEKKREQMRIEQEQERQRRMKQIFRCVHYDMNEPCYNKLNGIISEELFFEGPRFWPNLEPISETECQCRICKKVLPIDQYRKLEQAAKHVEDAGKWLDKSLVSKLVEGIEPGYFRGLGGEEIEYLASPEQPGDCYMWPDGTKESIKDYREFSYWRWRLPYGH